MHTEELTIIVRFSDICNLDCVYCYVPKSQRKKSLVVNTEELKKFFKSILCSDMIKRLNIIWHGGEPSLVDPSLLKKISNEVKAYAEEKEVSFMLQTNSYKISKEFLEFIHYENIIVGVSLDAPGNIHNKFRPNFAGDSTLKNVLKNIKELKNQNSKVVASCVLHKENVNKISEIYDFFKSNDIDFQFSPIFMGESTSIDDYGRLQISLNDYAQAMIMLYDLYISDVEKSIKPIDIVRIIKSFSTGQTNYCQYDGNCHKYLGVKTNGDIYSCDNFAFDNMIVGNISNTSLEDLVASKSLNQIQKRSENLRLSECKNCGWWDYCHGGCSSLANIVYNDPLKKDPFCEARIKIFEHILNTSIQN